jgi:hypothetical protein
MILDDDESDEADAEDEAEDTSGDADAGSGRIEQDASPHNALTTSELASRPAKTIDAPGLENCFDLEEGWYVYEPVSRLESCEQQEVPSAPAQDQPHTFHQSPGPSQDQINQQDISDIVQSTSVESAPHSCPSLPTTAMMDGLRTAWLNWGRKWGWLWQSK